MNTDANGELQQRLEQARCVLVLTGAGVSAESGVPTFRGADGLWRKYRAEDLATPEAFQRDPRLVWEWYDWRRQRIAKCQPNMAHHGKAGEILPRLLGFRVGTSGNFEIRNSNCEMPPPNPGT